ncbi:MAG: hypothetical protein GX595_20915, partial [Lentisphaerae bacterium]|nr:hypothetical protein [Lentisphaerota bacterium]
SLGFDQPRRIAGAMIFWNVEDGRFYSARRFRVLAQTAQGLQEVARGVDLGDRTCDRLEWAPVEATALRLEQEAGGGAAGRPNILWLREIAVIPAAE